MVANFGKPIDLHLNEMRNAVIQNLGADPGSLVAGLMWFNTVSGLMKWHNGSAVIDPLNRSNHSGTQLAATISDFTAAVQALRWASMTAPNAAVNMNSQQFTGLPAASGNGQAVEYAQFNTALANIATGMDLKETQAQVVATANINTASPGATISGHAMVANDRVLLSAQTTASQNGLWVWNGSAVAMTRAADANTTGSILGGTMVVVGDLDATNPNTVWMQTATGTGTNGAITIGTDNQTWIRVLSPVTLTAGNGIAIAAGVISAVVAASGGLTVGGSGLALDTTIAVRKYSTTLTGDGTTTSWTITHNLGSNNPDVNVRIAGAKWEVDDQVASAGASTTQVIIGISPAPANGIAIAVSVQA
jgi:hypothetical protein